MQLPLAESVGVGRHVVSWRSITDPLPSKYDKGCPELLTMLR